MTRIIDTRHSGGDLVVLGRSIVLPSTNSDATIPMLGSIRFGRDSGRIETYTHNDAGDLEWRPFGYMGEFLNDYLKIDGGTITGSLLFEENAKLYMSDGTESQPSITYDSDPSKGIYAGVDFVGVSIQGQRKLGVDPTGVSVKTKLTLISETGGADAIIHAENGVAYFTGNISAPSFLGNASTASKLTNPFSLSLSGDASGTVSIDGSSNVTLSVDVPELDDKLPLSGGTISGNVIPNANNTINLGSNTNSFSTVYAENFVGTATFAMHAADIAERYEADAIYEPGTVMILGGDKEVTISTHENSRSVAGVISTEPAHVLNASAGSDDYFPAIALKGRVPCKVVGTVYPGQLLVTSACPGYAQASDNPMPYTAIGRAINKKTDNGFGVVEIMIV